MPWTYILRCSDGTFYVGSTWDLERRIAEHDEGFGAAYTRRRRPVELVWAGDFQRIEDAFLLEKQVQGWGRAKRIALIEGRFDDLPGMGSRGYAGTEARQRAQQAGRPELWSPPVVEEVAQQPVHPVVEEVAQQPVHPVVEEVAQQPSRDPRSRDGQVPHAARGSRDGP